MGQEASCKVHFGKKAFEGKALLETGELIFRGGFRLAIPFREMRSVEAAQGRLKVAFPEGVAEFDLGPLAENWAFKILHPKSLIDKLGVTPDSKVSVLKVRDEAFRRQLKQRTRDVTEGRPQKDSDFIFFSAESKEELKRLGPLRQYIKKNGAIWVISPKGKKGLAQSEVMAAARRAGLLDVKVAGFSETHSALKLVIPVARR